MFGDISDDMSDDDILAFMDSVLGSEDSFVPEKDVSFTPDDPDAVPSFGRSTTIEEPKAEVGDLPDDPDEAIAWLQDLADSQDDEDVPTTSMENLDEILPQIDDDFAADLLVDVPTETAVGDDNLDFDNTVADSLPDWLEFGSEERMTGHTDWLRSLPEPDVAGWLEAEEEVMSANIFEEIPVPTESDQLPSYTSTFDDTMMPEPEMDTYEDAGNC